MYFQLIEHINYLATVRTRTHISEEIPPTFIQLWKRISLYPSWYSTDLNGTKTLVLVHIQLFL